MRELLRGHRSQRQPPPLHRRSNTLIENRRFEGGDPYWIEIVLVPSSG